MNVDWAFCEAIKNTNVPANGKVLLLYDIYCQWSIHFRDRVAVNKNLSLPKGLTVDGGIGLFHVHGHRDECLYRYAPYFISGAAVVDGEVLERLWSVLNLVSRSTRTATLAHRAEVLDDHMNDNNWKKLISMGEKTTLCPQFTNIPFSIVSLVCKRYKTAKDSVQDTLVYYQEITKAVAPPLVAEWTGDIEYAERERRNHPEVMDIMGTKGQKRMH